MPDEQLENLGIKKIGTVVFIVELESRKIWVVEEKTTKDSTGKTNGSISVPLETRKKGEFIQQNTLGAFEEFRSLRKEDEVVWVHGISYKGRFNFIPKVLADVVIVGVRGNKEDFRLQEDNEEVKFLGWKKIEEVRGDSRLRSGVGRFVEMCDSLNWIDDFLEGINDPGKRKSTICGKDLELFIQRRVSQIDYGE